MYFFRTKMIKLSIFKFITTKCYNNFNVKIFFIVTLLGKFKKHMKQSLLVARHIIHVNLEYYQTQFIYTSYHLNFVYRLN